MRPLIVILIALCAGLAHAGDAQPMAQDPRVEARMLAISEELRCLVCQNESLASSRAELASDLRDEVRRLIRESKSDQEIKQYLVARYGDFVLYRPPVKPTTWLLWFGPFALLGGGVLGLLLYLRRRTAAAPEPTLSSADIARAAALLDDTEGKL